VLIPKKTWLAAIGLLLATTVNASGAPADIPDTVANHWLMMVMTENTDPAREAQFNDWYDNVDIPDVLEVPGYQRARRGIEQRIPEFTAADSQSTPARYVALYDIRSGAIDKTLIDMLMASWGMEKSHHSTDLLKVTERVYFHQYGPAHAAPGAKPAHANPYLYMARFDCCRDPAAARSFDRWYDHEYAAALLASGAVTRITRYELYRVLMDKPVQIPRFLSVIELDAESAAQAAEAVRQAGARLSGEYRTNASIAEGARSLFLKIRDVKRP
jgi:hypothetical protein